jgi:hypothetical protein
MSSLGERLHEIVVRARFPSFDARLFPRACREQQDRHRTEHRIAPHFPQEAEAIHPRHHDVREDQIGRVSPRRSQRGRTIAGGFDVERLAQHPFDVLAHVRVVVGQQDAPARRVRVRSAIGRRLADDWQLELGTVCRMIVVGPPPRFLDIG